MTKSPTSRRTRSTRTIDIDLVSPKRQFRPERRGAVLETAEVVPVAAPTGSAHRTGDQCAIRARAIGPRQPLAPRAEVRAALVQD